jgi:hypothetical protein
MEEDNDDDSSSSEMSIDGVAYQLDPEVEAENQAAVDAYGAFNTLCVAEDVLDHIYGFIGGDDAPTM